MFKPFDEISDWSGYYKRPWGRESSFHVTMQNRIRICQNNHYDRYLFLADNDYDSQQLALAVNNAHHHYNHQDGGSFSINEFGIVIVPVRTAENNVAIKQIGTWSGTLNFRNHNNQSFSLNETLPIGAGWKYSYLGMKYNLSAQNQIYRWIENTQGGSKELPMLQDTDLIANLRQIRPHGAMTFLVNNHGVVLAKREDDDGDWIPRYAGRINPLQWFENPLDDFEMMDEGDVRDLVARLKRIQYWRDAADKKQFEALLNKYWIDKNRMLYEKTDQRCLLALADEYL